MNQNFNSQISPSGKGIDIYLYMDYTLAAVRDHSSLVLLGRAKRNSEQWDDRKFGHWITDTYGNIINSVCSMLNLDDNRVSVAICGHERYIMMELTNNLDSLKKCTAFKKFAFGGGEVTPCAIPSWRGYNPYKEMYYSIMNNRINCPGRKAVGIIITQSNIQKKSERQEILNIIKSCSNNNIDIITIGIRNKKVKYEAPIDKEILFSNNKDLSVICEYNDMLTYLKKILRLKMNSDLKEKKELEQDIEKFCKHQKRYSEYSEKLSELEEQYKNFPDIKLHESNITPLYNFRE